MPDLTMLLHQYGHAMVFGWVLLEALGVPVPATPLLITAGALTASGKLNFVLVVAVYTAAAFLGDLTWYMLGRANGARVLRLMCSISLEPDTCVRHTQERFRKWGLSALLISKFVPGLSTVASPLAGVNGAPLLRFVAYDATGACLYGLVMVGLGNTFNHQVEWLLQRAESAGQAVIPWAAGLFLTWIAFKLWTRWRFLRSMDMPRITPQELRQRMERQESLAVVDVRHEIELEVSGVRLPGALHAAWDEADKQIGDHNTLVVLYCACPHEVTAAKGAQRLKQLGWHQVFPLEGGLTAWTALGYPVDTVELFATTA